MHRTAEENEKRERDGAGRENEQREEVVQLLLWLSAQHSPAEEKKLRDEDRERNAKSQRDESGIKATMTTQIELPYGREMEGER